MERTDEEIDDVLDAALQSVDKGSTRWPGMTYEQGVDATIRWMRGDSDESPMED